MWASIDWDDGTQSAGVVLGGNVYGSHTYADDGPYAVAVEVVFADNTGHAAVSFGDVLRLAEDSQLQTASLLALSWSDSGVTQSGKDLPDTCGTKSIREAHSPPPCSCRPMP